MIKDRMFAVPFNGSAVDGYLKLIEPYMPNIEHVYMGINTLCNSQASIIRFNSDYSADSIINYVNNCYLLLKELKGIKKRIITINNSFYNFTDVSRKLFVETDLSRFIYENEPDGFILTDFKLACMLHEKFPFLELQTSCNTYMWSVREMRIWQEMAGISLFNPPREILRTPEKLKEMHEAGFKLKCLVNEACLYGCPERHTHDNEISVCNNGCSHQCNRGDLVNMLRSNFIVPRWMERLDRFVDIYKIAGRRYSNERLALVFDAFFNCRNDINLLDIIHNETLTGANERIRYFPVSAVPDKLLYCECKKCDVSCTKCRETVIYYMNR